MNGFYFDEHMRWSVVRALREQRYYVVRAVDVGMEGKDDDTEHLPYATQNNLVMVTFDRPFAGRTMLRSDFIGLICLREDIRSDVGKIIEELITFAELFDPLKDSGQVYWLP